MFIGPPATDCHCAARCADVLLERVRHIARADHAFPLFNFSARALKFASRPGKDCSASAFSMKLGTRDESFRSMAYVASVVPGCAPGFNVQAPSLPFTTRPWTFSRASLSGRSAVDRKSVV